MEVVWICKRNASEILRIGPGQLLICRIESSIISWDLFEFGDWDAPFNKEINWHAFPPMAYTELNEKVFTEVCGLP